MCGREVTYRRDGSTDEREFSHRLFSYSEMSGMLNRAGFAVESAYGDYSGSVYTIDSNQMIILAEKDE